MIKIYKVFNKNFEIHFTTREKAENFIKKIGSTTVDGLEIIEVVVF